MEAPLQVPGPIDPLGNYALFLYQTKNVTPDLQGIFCLLVCSLICIFAFCFVLILTYCFT